MTDAYDTTADVEDRLDEDTHQHAVEAAEHALDALHNNDLARAHSLLDEAQAAVERAQHDESRTQEQREIASDCYD